MTRHHVVIDLGFGDAGKGATVDWLTSRYAFPNAKDRPKLVVRFNGGAQAGHNVQNSGKYGWKHTFSQFGSGYYHGLETLLSRFMLVDPLAMIKESEHLKTQSVVDPLTTILVDRNARLVTPFHAAANKARERQRGDDRHGSCGMGIGETMAFSIENPSDTPYISDIQDPRTLRRKLWTLHDYYKDLVPTSEMPPIDPLMQVYREWANVVRLVDERWLPMMLPHYRTVFEGAQGVLLDQDHGFHPYTTWSKTTPDNALELLREADQEGEAEIVGVTRTYSTRHGAGPFPAEDAGMTARLPDEVNVTGEWQGNFRVGPLDIMLLDYALRVVGGVDWLAVTNVDRVGPSAEFVREYAFENGDTLRSLQWSTTPNRPLQIDLTKILSEIHPVLEHTDDIIETIRERLGVRIGMTSHGPRAEHKEWATDSALVLTQ